MFGLFKSKEDKEVDKLTKTLRSTKEAIYFDGNIVFDLATKINNRYNLTVSTIDHVSNPGLLTSDIEDSGYIVIAISKSEAIYVDYQKGLRRTRVLIGKTAQHVLDKIQKGIENSALEAEKEQGTVYKNTDWINIVGAVTTLGYQVGMPEADEELYFPFNYKDNKFYIIGDDEGVWVVFDEKRKKEDMTYNGKSHKQNSKFGESQFLAAIEELNNSEISSLRLNAKNLGEADEPIYGLGLETVYGVDDDIGYFKYNNKIYGTYVVDDRYIHMTDFSDRKEPVDFQVLVDKVNMRNEESKKRIEAYKNNDYNKS